MTDSTIFLGILMIFISVFLILLGLTIGKVWSNKKRKLSLTKPSEVCNKQYNANSIMRVCFRALNVIFLMWCFFLFYIQNTSDKSATGIISTSLIIWGLVVLYYLSGKKRGSCAK